MLKYCPHFKVSSMVQVRLVKGEIKKNLCRLGSKKSNPMLTNSLLRGVKKKTSPKLTGTPIFFLPALSATLKYHHHVMPSARISLTLTCHLQQVFRATSRVGTELLYIRMFKLVVLPLLVHVKGSTGVHHLCVRPYFFSNVPHVWFV